MTTITAPNPLSSDIDWARVQTELGVRIVQSPMQSDVVHPSLLRQGERGERRYEVTRREIVTWDGLYVEREKPAVGQLWRMLGAPELHTPDVIQVRDLTAGTTFLRRADGEWVCVATAGSGSSLPRPDLAPNVGRATSGGAV